MGGVASSASYTSTRACPNVTLRLGTLQVVNKFDDGEERLAHEWLRQNERDMATLAWKLAATRERTGFVSIKVLHRLGHPEKRKAAADFERMNLSFKSFLCGNITEERLSDFGVMVNALKTPPSSSSRPGATEPGAQTTKMLPLSTLT